MNKKYKRKVKSVEVFVLDREMLESKNYPFEWFNSYRSVYGYYSEAFVFDHPKNPMIKAKIGDYIVKCGDSIDAYSPTYFKQLFEESE